MSLSQAIRLDVRCGDCRSASWSSKNPERQGRADLLGSLIYWPGEGFDWLPLDRFSTQDGLRRADLSGPEHWDTSHQYMGRDFDQSLKARCREGHDVRRRRDRVVEAFEKALRLNGPVYL